MEMSAVVLTPGANTGIAAGGPVRLAVGWDPKSLPGMEVDASAFMVGADGKVPDDRHFVFYGAQASPEGSVRFRPDAATGAESDTQAFDVALSQVPATIDAIDVCVTIHEGQARGQSFDSLKGVFARLIDPSSGQELARFDLPVSGMTETAITLVRLYRRNGQWKMRAVGQGFAGGLAALATHLGVEIDAPEPAPAPSPTPKPTSAPEPAPDTKPVSLKKVTLTKTGATSRITLDKRGSGIIRVTATWIDNGDKSSNNDDLDLRAGLRMPDGSMQWLAASHPGDLTTMPYARHLGDVRTATKDAPGTEIIEVDAGISHKVGGPVAMVFSVYSAVSNGAVSIASLKPVMSVEHGDKIVTCAYDFPDGAQAKGVYTYVIGTVLIDGDDLDVRLSGLTSPPRSENTPWIEGDGRSLTVTFDGPAVFKKGRTLFARMMSSGTKKYANV